MKECSHTLPLLEWLRPREAAMARLLGQFVRAESPSIDKAAVDRFGKMVAAEWRRRGARVTLVRQGERGDHVRAEWNPTGSHAKGQILVLGHLDTVYGLGTLARTPFRLSRGRAYGPGALDMKGGLVIALFAVDAITGTGREPEKRVVFLWTSDEEIGSGSSRALIEREARRSDAVLVLEPASGLDGRVKTGRKGVGEIEIIATGRAAHAGLNPEDGVNAIEEIALQITRISRWNQPSRGITVSAGVIEGGTRTNVIPENARVVVDVRAERAGDMRALERKFRALRPDPARSKTANSRRLQPPAHGAENQRGAVCKGTRPGKRDGRHAWRSLRRRRIGRKFHGGAGRSDTRWPGRRRRRRAQSERKYRIARAARARRAPCRFIGYNLKNRYS